jgi:SNF2 family DNA or RNA helicase
MTITARLAGDAIDIGVGTLPLTLEACRSLRSLYGDQLVIDPDLGRWALEARRNPVARIAPAMAAAMRSRPFQLTAARAVAAKRNIGILDEGGLGKTVEALAGLMLADNWEGRHLVICPKTAVLSTWAAEIEKWTGGRTWAAVDTTKKKLQVVEDFLAADRGARFLVTNPESLRTRVEKFCPKCGRWVNKAPQVIPLEHVGQNHPTPYRVYEQPVAPLFGIEWDSVIADEVDQYMLGLRPQTGIRSMTLVTEGLIRLQSKQRIAMTGTPFHGKEHNIFGILHWLEPKEHKAFWQFVEFFFEVEINQFGDRTIGRVRPERADRFGALLDRHTIRRTRAEVRAELPDNLHHVHWVELEGEHRKQYQAMEDDGFVRLGADVLQGAGVLSELTRLKQMAFGSFDYRGQTLTPKTSPKYDLLVDMLAERGVTMKGPTFGHMKYIVASQFTDVLSWLEAKLNSGRIPTLRIDGSVTGAARRAAVDDFSSEGGARVLLLNTYVAQSITLDAFCDEMFILDETFVEDDQNQLRWRIDNRGARVAVRVFHYLRTKDTIDQRIADDNLDQAAMQDQLLDGRRGIEVAKRLLGRAA